MSNSKKEYISDGLIVENFDEAVGYRDGDTIDGMVLEKVINYASGDSVLFSQCEENDYQWVIASGKELLCSCRVGSTLDEVVADYEAQAEMA